MVEFVTVDDDNDDGDEIDTDDEEICCCPVILVDTTDGVDVNCVADDNEYVR